ncbi:hypothetical protein C9I98_14450 [Photobacterium sanctipauli]|uniref:Uncharacterized protein n=1 Tax=Photobacterium sanctipauli TaxID=1342794 RepID=A0A2T3NQX0_9GAMM|nr:hypothetical protein [Photobacterium sanctipauli]PSW18676.1 hypothetical protein C9I98_14450 [Photobacterium sanctipauli]
MKGSESNNGISSKANNKTSNKAVPLKATLMGLMSIAVMSGCSVVHEVTEDASFSSTMFWSDEDKARLERYPECKNNQKVMSCIALMEARADRDYEAKIRAREQELLEQEKARKAKEHEEWLKSPEGVAHAKEQERKAAEQERKQAAVKGQCEHVAKDFAQDYPVQYKGLRHWQPMYGDMVLCLADYIYKDVYEVEHYKVITFEYNTSSNRYQWRE